MDDGDRTAPPGDDLQPLSQRERMLAGEPRRGGDDPELGELFAKARRLVAAYNLADAADENGLRAILTQLLGSVGEGVSIRQPLFVDFGAHISIGARSFVNSA